MSTTPYLSVVMPTYRQPDLLRAALDSLAAQEFPPAAAEIVVVDDGTPRFDPADLDLAPCPFAVQWVRHSRNMGRAQARNSGVLPATGEIIVFLDGDMTLAPGFLAAHAAFHRAHPGEVAIGAIEFGPEVHPTAMSRYVHSRGVHAFAPGAAVPFKCFVTGNSSISRAHLDRVGLFDEELSQYGGEDLELGFRLDRDGATFRFAAEARSFHGHLRPFLDQLRLMETYGRTGIPHLVRRHPELGAVLRLSFLQYRTPLGLVLRLALSPLLYYPVRALTRLMLWSPVPSLVFSYLWWCSRTRGYRAATAPPSAG